MIKKAFEFIMNLLYVIVTRWLSGQALRVGKIMIALSLISLVLFSLTWFWPLLAFTVVVGLLGTAFVYIAKVINSRR